MIATDISADALALARENAELNGLDVEFVHGDLLAGLAGPFALVVSNPPYVEAGEIAALQPEVRDWEPRGALVDEGQTDRLIADARAVLDGAIVLEVHELHAERARHQLETVNYTDAKITQDLAGRDRVVEAHWRA